MKQVPITSFGLASEQTSGSHQGVILYKMMQDLGDLTYEQIELVSAELRRLYLKRYPVQIQGDGVMEIKVVPHGKPR